MCPTPMLYFADYYLQTDAAIMITGSHNPSEYNGFKMVLNKHSFFSNDIQNFQKIVSTTKLEKKNGKIKNVNLIDNYIQRIMQNIDIKKKLKISWDIGNGAMGVVIDKLIAKLNNTENILLNKDVDGNFPNHHPDPTVPKNMEQLIKSVKENNCDLGMAFDGDGDRLGVIDNHGNIVWADQYMLVLCSEIKNLYKNPKIIMDVKCSKVFFDESKKMGCIPIMERTGHSPIKEKMKELKSPLSGEMSGHVCYGDDFYGYDDALYVALRLIRILSNHNESLFDLVNKFPKTYSTPEVRFDVEEIKKFKIIDDIKNRLSNYSEKIIDIDGIRLETEEGWFLVRASNTQNQLTCRVESTSSSGLKKLINLLEDQLKLSDIDYKFTI
tara:strand:- start:1469 stop:2614 length:1146 start_codon:yes stop_codon:yes gene_type:complete